MGRQQPGHGVRAEAQPAAPAFWRMLSDILRFNRESVGLAAAQSRPTSGTLREFLERGRLLARVPDWYLLPMAAAIWSCPTGRCSTIRSPPSSASATTTACCRSSTGRCGAPCKRRRPRVREQARRGLDDIRLATPVQRVTREAARPACDARARAVERVRPGGAGLPQRPGAGHPRRRRQRRQREVLAPSATSPTAPCCTPTRAAAARRGLWSAWNYLPAAMHPTASPVSVSYLINRLQPLPFKHAGGGDAQPAARARSGQDVIAEFDYAHPIFDGPAIAAQRELPTPSPGRERRLVLPAPGAATASTRTACARRRVANRMGMRAPWQSAAARPVGRTRVETKGAHERVPNAILIGR
jgi:hypothetical protein